MIDEKKYEGHTEGEWKVGARKGAMTVRDSNGEEIAATNSYLNARLMADAPLLLAEVIRLREELERMTTLCTWWVAEAERLEKEMEMIE
tara:strand:+ start:998 stop:1264 length:267 start_codon:yes stop_codon:yes gene_type:complete